MAKISVIVPVYNVEEYLSACVDSILAQSYEDFELILVDDGSPDHCGAICDEYAKKDARVRVIHQENGGLSAARNAGLDIAKGEFVTFIDSDDVIAECYMERLAFKATEYNADIVTCRMGEFEKDIPTYILSDVCEVMDGRAACMKIYEMDSAIWVSACDKLFRRELFSILRFPVGKCHEDQATTPLAVYHAAKVVVTEDVLYYYRIRDNSIMHQPFSLKRYDDIEGIDACISFFESKKEYQIVAKAKEMRCILLSKYALSAKKEGMQRKVPPKYRLSERKALSNLRKLCTDDKYTYYLAQIHPSWLRPHVYLRKIKKILHIPCK